MRHEILKSDRSQPLQGNTKAHAALVAYTATRYPVSTQLPRGSQCELMNAAKFSVEMGFPVNVMTTINAAQLQRIGEGGVFAVGHLWDGLQCLLELMRKWTTERGLPWVAFWSREVAAGKAPQLGEHWHIAHHLPKCHRADFAAQLAVWTGEAHDPLRTCGKGDFAFSAHDAWHIKQHIRGGRGPDCIAAYLGKAEPNCIRLHGKMKDNPDKQRRERCGGSGPIEGKRYGIARSIDHSAQRKARFTGPFQRAAARPGRQRRARGKDSKTQYTTPQDTTECPEWPAYRP